MLRLLKGEELDAVSREVGVSAAKLAEWRDDFLAAGQAGLKMRQPDPRDDEVRRLKGIVGDLMMEKELLEELWKMQGDRLGPLPRRSRE